MGILLFLSSIDKRVDPALVDCQGERGVVSAFRRNRGGIEAESRRNRVVAVSCSAMRRALVGLILLLMPAAVAAQDRKWEIEGYAGVLAGQPASAGSVHMPPPGPPIVTSSPTFPARATSSWLFGDGAKLLNGVLEEFGRTPRVAPLDPLFGPMPSSHPAALGLRVRRRLNPRVALEVSVDGFSGSSIHTEEISEAIGASFDSLGSALTDLFASGPFSASRVVAAEGLVHAPYEETAITVAVNHDGGRLGPMQPYLTFGGGIVIPDDEHAAGGSIAARYTTAILGEVPIDETDNVRVEFTRPKSFVAVIGGGLRHDFSRPWSFRVDARMLVGPDTTRVTLDATPLVARGAPAGFIESFTNPAIQFSNDPATGRVSSLSGPVLSGVEVFKGGVLMHAIVSASIAWRF